MTNEPSRTEAEAALAFWLLAKEAGLISDRDSEEMEMLADAGSGEGAFADAARRRLVASVRNLLATMAQIVVKETHL